MNQALLFILDSDSNGQDIISSGIRMVFAHIIKFLYDWIGKLVDVMYEIASKDLGLGEFTSSLSEKIFVILLIFMVFKLTLSIMTYLIDPDSFSDSTKGFQGILKRVIIAIVLLVSINPIFTLLFDLQDTIINDDIITNFVMGSSGEEILADTENNRLYLTEISPLCNDFDPGKKVITFSQGDHLALLTLKPFIQPVSDYEGDKDDREKALKKVGYCGTDVSELDNLSYTDTSSEALNATIPGIHSASEYMQMTIYAGYTGGLSFERNIYYIDFNYFFALLIGFIVFLILISFCFDVVIRSFTLMLLQVLAPIPIVLYISPKGKSNETLGTWLKKLISTWLMLFIEMLALNIALSAITTICESLSNDDSGFLMQVIVILGTLMFAKKLPKLLEELIPGLKLSGKFELNPFKRISRDALGGNAALGLGAAAGAMGLAGATNFGHRTGSFIKNKGWQGEDGKFSLRKTAGGLGKIAGSSVAGATRAGVNAFGRTSKDGKILSGAWGGYQTSMFSKLQREDNLRKAGLEDASLLEKAKFTAGSTLADASRYVGVLNKGQQEYLNAARQDEIIKSMEERKAQEKSEKLIPLQTYSKYAQRIKERIDNSGVVKEAQTGLDTAISSGDMQAVKAAQTKLDLAKNEAAQNLFKNDKEVQDLEKRMNEIRKQNVQLQAEAFNFQKADGTFDSNSIYNTTSFANKIELDIENKDIYNVEGYKRGNVDVVSAVNNAYNGGIDLGNYRENHDDSSMAKLQNSQRMNKDIQQPGFKPSSGPIQQKAFDGYAGGHPGSGSPQGSGRPGNGTPQGNPRGGGRPH